MREHNHGEGEETGAANALERAEGDELVDVCGEAGAEGEGGEEEPGEDAGAFAADAVGNAGEDYGEAWGVLGESLRVVGGVNGVKGRGVPIYERR